MFDNGHQEVIMKKLIIAAAILMMASGCAVGPLVNHEAARTVGEGKDEFVAGYGVTSYVLKWTRGISDNLDYSIQLEALSLGVKLKYAFINNPEKGFSLSGAAGYGASIGGNHYYVDISTGYLKKGWEPYTTLRIVRVDTDPMEFKDEDTGEVEFTIDQGDFTYGQYMLGLRYWMTERWLVSLEGSTLFGISNVKFGQNSIVGLAFGYKF